MYTIVNDKSTNFISTPKLRGRGQLNVCVPTIFDWVQICNDEPIFRWDRGMWEVILLSLQCSLSCFVPSVVVWSDLLGGIQPGQNTLPSHCKSWDDWLPGTRIQAKETCSLQWKYVSEYHVASWMHCYEIGPLPCFVSWSSSSVSVKVANCFYHLHKHTKEKVTK